MAEKPATRTEFVFAIGLISVFLFAIIILTIALNGVRRSDFTCFYTSGLIIRQGHASRLYDPDEQARIQRQLFNRKDLLIDPHPPFEALWFAALAGLSCTEAYVFWGAINVLLWLFFQQLLRRHTPTPKSPYHYFWLCSLFAPLWIALMQGQTTVLLLILFSLTYVSLKQSQDLRAGFFLGLGLFKFPVVFPFAIICLLRRKWKMLAGCALAGALLVGVSILTVGPIGVRSYFHLLLDIVNHPERPAYANMGAWEKMPTIKGLFTVLLSGRLPHVDISLLVAAISACLILFTAWRWRQEDNDPGDDSLRLMFAAALAASEVTAPHLYIHDLTLMLLAVLLVIGSSQWSQKSSQRMMLTVIIVILYSPPVYLLLLKWQALDILAAVLVAFTLATISLAGKAQFHSKQSSAIPSAAT